MPWSHLAGPRLVVVCGPALSLLFPTALCIGCHLFRSGVHGLKDHPPRPHLLCIKQTGSQNQAGKLTNIGMTNTLRKILKDQKACHGKEEGLIQGFPITRLTLPLLRALHRFYRLSYKLRDGLGLIILPYVELEITGHFSFLGRGLPKGVPDKLILIPVRNVSPT
ncbi:LOW QUALITY PROTEIN: hypothetical protein Cgig2_006763 [Carnegiea gigantea]|uniref:Uncharacterized protein n=1 Tax=Carnegiea gigantea TaxID=171969 RepID=A0A9Q1GQC8_9CARY|nr:LOW QUALITY PROTEIN: hypothetical protein Cgig2_006763 [Carnegiea gigantea]